MFEETKKWIKFCKELTRDDLIKLDKVIDLKDGYDKRDLADKLSFFRHLPEHEQKLTI